MTARLDPSPEDSRSPASTRSAGRPWYVRLAFKVLASGLSLTVALVLGEIVVRWLVPQQSYFAGRGMFAPDPDVGHVLRPNFHDGGIQTNAHGFRDRDYAILKPAGTYRVIGIGDSFMFGACRMEDNFLEYLERFFASSSPTPVEVINTGVSAYNTRQEIELLKKYGMPFQPDAVVLGFFLGNDIQENEEDIVFDVVDGELTNLHRRPGLLRRWLMRSHLYRLLSGSLFREARAAAEGLPDFLDIEFGRLQVCRKVLRPEREEGYRLSEHYIVALRDYLSERNVELIVLLIPDEIQVNLDVFRRVMEKHQADPVDYDLEQPNRRFRSFLLREQIYFVDALGPLRRKNQEGRVYNVDETHLNPIGNKLVAERLLRAFQSRVPALRDWPRATITPRGRAHPGATVTFELDAPSCGGHPYQLASSLGYGQTPFGRLDLPLRLDNAFCASVCGGLPPVFVDYTGVLDAHGRGRAKLRLPPMDALVGQTVHTVFMVLDRADLEKPLTASEPVIVRIGERKT